MTNRSAPAPVQASEKPSAWLNWLSWGVAIIMVALLVLMLFRRVSGVTSAAAPTAQPVTSGAAVSALPDFVGPPALNGITRQASIRTIIPTREREDVITYTVQAGDSVFGIAKEYNLKPESVLWANYETLNDDPQMIEVGLQLYIPATDGVLYKWKDGDTVEKVAERFKTKADNILLWPGNNLDVTNPVIQADTYVMLPGGSREFRTWVVPTIARGQAGVNKTIIGPGACETGEGGAYGTGGFIWPSGNHVLSGNDYWSGHLGIDIAAGLGAPVFAADSGVIVYAGPIGGGYGNMVMIDHGNGYQTLYAHLSTINVRCGSSVYQGQNIAGAGSTGRSTGPHLHFEVRYLGGFINPWSVLP